jgi:molecular chaperone GrpE
MTEERTGPLTPDALSEAEELEALRAELDDMKQQFLRARADYQNLQRRAQEERQEFGRYQLVSLVRNILPVLDDLQRALEAAEGQADAAWLEGIRLVEQKFRGTLEAAGVQEIHALNQPFNPEQHEAVGAAPGPEGRVVQIVQRGYMLQDRVIRAAMVLVGNGEDTGSAPEASGDQTNEQPV